MEERAAMGHAAVLVRGPASVPRDVRRDRPEHSLPLETERATSSAAWQEDFADASRHDAAERAHHESHRRPVLERGHDPRLRCSSGSTQEGVDVRPGYKWVWRLLRGMCLTFKKPAKCLKELDSPALQEANTHRLFIKLCWLHGQARSQRRPCREHRRGPPAASSRCIKPDGAARRQTSQLQGNTREATTFTVAFSMDRGPAGHAGADRARRQDRRLSCPSSPGWRSRTHHVTSENGWATTTTLLQLVATLDHVMNRAGRDSRGSSSGTWPASTPARPPWPP